MLDSFFIRSFDPSEFKFFFFNFLGYKECVAYTYMELIFIK